MLLDIDRDLTKSIHGFGHFNNINSDLWTCILMLLWMGLFSLFVFQIVCYLFIKHHCFLYVDFVSCNFTEIRSLVLSVLAESLGFFICKTISSVSKNNFTSVLIWITLFLFIAWSLLLGFIILCWIGVMRVGTLFLFLILEERFSTYHH